MNDLLNKVGVKITKITGTMYTAIAFTVLALISLPGAIKTHDTIVIVAWIAQTFLQLVLLPIIMVGQNQTSKKVDKNHKAVMDTQRKRHLEILNHLRSLK
jgi:hypothetical protein